MPKQTASTYADKRIGSLVRYGNRLARLDKVTKNTVYLFDLVEDDYIVLKRKDTGKKPARKL